MRAYLPSRGHDIGGSYLTGAKTRTRAAARRRALAKQGLCINGESHGKTTHGPRCEWCHAVHRHGLEWALENKVARPSTLPQPAPDPTTPGSARRP